MRRRSSPSAAINSTSPTRAATSRRARCGTSTPREETADRDAVEASHEFTAEPGLHTVRPPEVMEAPVGRGHLRRDPATGPLGVTATGHHLVEGGVDPDLEPLENLPEGLADAQVPGHQYATRVR